MSTREQILQLTQRMGQSIIGQEQVIQRLLLTLLATGNLLLEGLPGLAKVQAALLEAMEAHQEPCAPGLTALRSVSSITGTATRANTPRHSWRRPRSRLPRVFPSDVPSLM
jgi:MoxR-like ATPase